MGSPPTASSPIANGEDSDNRSNALEVFKSGLFDFMNAIPHFEIQARRRTARTGHAAIHPEEWLELFADDAWHALLIDGYTIAVCQGGPAGEPVERAIPARPNRWPIWGGLCQLEHKLIDWET